MTDYPILTWKEARITHSVRWRSESGLPPPKRVIVVDDTLKADAAYHHACEGTAMLWRGDFQNAKMLLQAIARRVDNRARAARKAEAVPFPQAFHLHRQAQAQRARTLGMLLIPFDAGHTISLGRAPDVQLACDEVYGAATEPYVTSLRELLGIIGAREWRKTGIDIAATGGRIHPHYGVFAPVRSEYVQLVELAPLPSTTLAFDIGTGTGVLAAALARKGVARVIATESDARALACARENILQLGLSDRVEVVQSNLFPENRAPLIVCNPPWIPSRPSSPLEHAIYDFESRMLRNFLDGLAAHLTPAGEGWLILSDIAEHLGLRTRAELLAWIEKAGLKVLGKTDIKPKHPRTADASDPLHKARAAEVTSLWRLAAMG
ncbi:MAG TPA: class I SAM-dependent methyltransferase [Burkholderiales bacterium]|nr:class I SAM-dependent methyltransferase [Burkholderiales bacterium]